MIRRIFYGGCLCVWLLLCFFPENMMAMNESSSSSLTILALGDSITAGTPGFLSPAEVPPRGKGNPQSQYAYWINRLHPDWKIENQGVAGQTSAQILNRLIPAIERFSPDIVIVMAGVNDLYGGLPPERVIQNLKTIYEKARERGVDVIALTILPYNLASQQKIHVIREVNAWIQEYAEKEHLGFCDTYSIMENPQHAGKLISSSDGLHPDVDGYRKMGTAIALTLETWTSSFRPEH